MDISIGDVNSSRFIIMLQPFDHGIPPFPLLPKDYRIELVRGTCLPTVLMLAIYVKDTATYLNVAQESLP